MAIRRALFICFFCSAAAAEKPCTGDGPEGACPLVTSSLLQRPGSGGLNAKLKNVAEFDKETSGDPKLAAEADLVESDLSAGGATAVENDASAMAAIVDLLNKESAEVSPQDAAEDGIEITSQDITELNHGVNMEEKNNATFQGDMMPESSNQSLLFMQIESKHGAYAWAGTPWPGGVVKYCFASNLPDNAKKAWALSIVQYKKAVPCLQWVDVGYKSGSNDNNGNGNGRCKESGAIFVQAEGGGGCWSYVGKTSHANQPVQIESPGCDSVGTTMHEIGHALGMAHEQSRPDRDEYVSIDFGNTAEDAQFKISKNGDTARPYDILSLMHYGVGDFATDKTKPVITVKPKGYEKYTSNPAEYSKYEIGSRIGLSQSDVDQLADMYKNVASGGCKASTLSSSTTCVDKLKNGAPFRDNYGDCKRYRDTSTAADPCSKYGSRSYCCGCGGGWEVQSYGGAQSGSPNTVATPATTPPAVTPATTAAPITPATTAVPITTATPASCQDSQTYKDPTYGESCQEWKDFGCDYWDFSAELKSNCPATCKVC